ncbi:unnamed protein product, partial [Sphacelaria rigidula]
MRDMTPTPSVRRRKRAVYVMMGLLAAFPSAAGASGEGSRPSVPGWTNTRGDGYPQQHNARPLSEQAENENTAARDASAAAAR